MSLDLKASEVPSTVPPTPPTNPPANIPTVEQALAHCAKLEEHVMKFVGKDEHNPYVWLENSGVNAFRRAVRDTKENGAQLGQSLIEAALAIQLEDPKV
jgi:hypothetical protein